MPTDVPTEMCRPYEGPAIFLVDLDAFFASVELLDHPEWRGKPVIVGGDARRRGVVSTCSYEARAFGVHSAMPSWQAEKLCPQAIWASGRMERYQEVSRQVMAILGDETPRIDQVSIDEAFLDVTPGIYRHEHPLLVAQRISTRVSDEAGVTCSIGIGTTKSIAKIASDVEKPCGITIVYPGTERAFLSPLPVRALSGVGKRAEERLAEAGITTLGEMAQASRGMLEPIFGVNWDMMRERARGTERSAVAHDDTVKSVSNEQTFSEDLTDRSQIESAIDLMAVKVARRLRRKGLAGYLLTLKLKYDDLSIHTAQTPSPRALDDEYLMNPQLHRLLDQVWTSGIHVRLVGVGVSDFGQRAEQLALFEDAESTSGVPRKPCAPRLDETESAQLVQATDKVKDRFGEGALRYGRELKFRGKDTGNKAQNIEKP